MDEIDNEVRNSQHENIIGTVISDESSPTFEIFKFKAKSNKYVTPGSLVATTISENVYLVGRVTSSHEHNPHESSDRVTVRDTMDITPDYPEEDLSLTIHRRYKVEIIDEVKKINGKYHIYPSENMPKSGSEVFVPPKNVIMEIMGLEDDSKKSFNIGTLDVSLMDEDTIPVKINREIIQRHIFIGGTTGGGKSYASRVLAEEIHKQGIPIIFFDTQYEFVPLTEALGGKSLIPGKDYWVKLSSLTESELLSLIPTITHELHVSLLTKAFLTLKEGETTGIPQQTIEQYEESDNDAFDVNKLVNTIKRIGPSMQAKDNTIEMVAGRTKYYLGSYNFLGEEFNWGHVLKPASVTCINCKDFSRHALQLILASTLRELSELRKKRQINPFIIFIDEAHLFVPQDENSPCKQIIRESVRIGRHHGICTVLITQSPMDIDKKAIRQCNTRLLFAIEPDQLQSIQGVKADATREMIDRLPKAPVGSCILTGTYETIKHAIPVKIRKMENPEADAGKAPDIFSEVGN